MEESRKESIREEALRAKEINREEAIRVKMIAVEKYNAGDFVGAKESALEAQKLDPELCGLQRLNTVLDVRMRYEKSINGDQVDWYAVLAVEPAMNLGTIQQSYSRLAKAIIYDRDSSVGSIVEAQKILADAFRYLAKEKKEELMEKKRQEIRLSRITGDNKRILVRPSTDLFQYKEPSGTSEDAARRDRVELTPNKIQSALVNKSKLSLERFASSSQHKNVGATSETKSYQDSKKCNATKRVRFDVKKTDEMVVEKEPNEVDMTVPDPDFYDFDKDRTEASFGKNEIWSAYDDSDGMPRFYAMVHNVVSREPFKVRISWLNSKSNDELGPMKWIDSGYYKTSGRFSIGRKSNYKTLHSFSHKVEWKQDAKGFVHIYPKKGNVWALYANWSPSWDISTQEEVMYKYEMVEVLQDMTEEGFVKVAPLVKVPGFRTVFCRHPNLRTFPRQELFRFSHQVASHLLTGEEGTNAPKGCLELDPAALSRELLKVVTEEEIQKM